MAFHTPEIDHPLHGTLAAETTERENDAALTEAALNLAAVFTQVAGRSDPGMDGFVFLGWLLALFGAEDFPKGDLYMRLRNVTPDATGFSRFVRPFVTAAPWGTRHAAVVRALQVAERAI